MNKADKGRSVVLRGRKSLSLLLALAIATTAFLFPVKLNALENTTPIVAVAITETATRTGEATRVNETTRKIEAAPLVAVPVAANGMVLPENYVNDYLGFTRTDLVRYLVEHADDYLDTPYTYDSLANPVLGPDGGMQCETFLWHAMFQVSTTNRGDVPCGIARTEPLGNGGGWVNWAYYHGVEPLEFATKQEMLASGVLEKGDIIWSFDAAGPYGLSSANHAGFFWGDTPYEDKFWHTTRETEEKVLAGKADGNRITQIMSVSSNPSVWWVFKMAPDEEYNVTDWARKPALTAYGNTASNAVASEGASATAPEEKEIVFFEG